MSMSSTNLLARLDELKKWQEKQQKRLIEKQKRTEQSNSDYQSIEGLSEFDSMNCSHEVSLGNQKARSSLPANDERVMAKNSPVIEHKIAESHSPPLVRDDSPPTREQSDIFECKRVDSDRPKKPFLKCGVGLRRFGMKPGDQKRPFNKRAIKRDVKNYRNMHGTSSKQEDKKKSELKPEMKRQDDDVVPLNVPDYSIKATWHRIGNEVEACEKRFGGHDKQDLVSQINKFTIENIGKYVGSNDKFTTNMHNQDVLQHEAAGDAYMPKRFTETEDGGLNKPSMYENALVTKQVAKTKPNLEILQCVLRADVGGSYETKDPTEVECRAPSEQSLYEKALEKELLIFEALEQKAMHNSFSSTNSSVIRILSSTPRKTKGVEVRDEKLEVQNANLETSSVDKIESDDGRQQFGLKNSPSIENKKRMVHFEVNAEDAIMKLLQSLKDRNSADDIQGNLEMDNTMVACTSSHSSIDSDDFEEVPIPEVNFKDTECWSDTNACHSPSVSSSSSLESASTMNRPKITEQEFNIPDLTDGKKESEAREHLLFEKLQELDREIQSFRKENGKVQKIKIELDNERREFKREKKAFEKYVLEEKINVEFYLEDEKKKLAKEKMVFERYVKDVNNKSTRKEREEITALKSEVANIKEAAKLKDTRNATSQARLRSQIKTLEKENANLKEEVEKLLKQNAKLQASQKLFNKKSTDTKMLHEINKNLTKLSKDAKVSKQLNKIEENHAAHEEERKPTAKRSDSIDDTNGNVTGDNGTLANECNKCASTKLKLQENSEEKEGNRCDESNYYRIVNASTRGNLLSNEPLCQPVIENSYEDYVKLSKAVENHFSSSTSSAKQDKLGVAAELKENNRNSANYDETRFKNLSNVSLVRNYEMTFGGRNDQRSKGSSEDGLKSKTEVILADGSTEVRYSNGNIKVTSSDGNFIVMKYFNGDIKETRLLEGVIRYYYAENQSWHSTFADGTEILEFPNGQTEKKAKDGSLQVSFSNGIVKTTKPDGSESISYPDGTQVVIDSDGEKVLLLPNGQKEIHNEEHKRREYPDGTVKILYPDGIQETRYSNGRIRIKDKNGKLMLDSHDENT